MSFNFDSINKSIYKFNEEQNFREKNDKDLAIFLLYKDNFSVKEKEQLEKIMFRSLDIFSYEESIQMFYNQNNLNCMPYVENKSLSIALEQMLIHNLNANKDELFFVKNILKEIAKNNPEIIYDSKALEIIAQHRDKLEYIYFTIINECNLNFIKIYDTLISKSFGQSQLTFVKDFINKIQNIYFPSEFEEIEESDCLNIDKALITQQMLEKNKDIISKIFNQYKAVLVDKYIQHEIHVNLLISNRVFDNLSGEEQLLLAKPTTIGYVKYFIAPPNTAQKYFIESGDKDFFIKYRALIDRPIRVMDRFIEKDLSIWEFLYQTNFSEVYKSIDIELLSQADKNVIIAFAVKKLSSRQLDSTEVSWAINTLSTADVNYLEHIHKNFSIDAQRQEEFNGLGSKNRRDDFLDMLAKLIEKKKLMGIIERSDIKKVSFKL